METQGVIITDNQFEEYEQLKKLKDAIDEGKHKGATVTYKLYEYMGWESFAYRTDVISNDEAVKRLSLKLEESEKEKRELRGKLWNAERAKGYLAGIWLKGYKVNKAIELLEKP